MILEEDKVYRYRNIDGFNSTWQNPARYDPRTGYLYRSGRLIGAFSRDQSTVSHLEWEELL